MEKQEYEKCKCLVSFSLTVFSFFYLDLFSNIFALKKCECTRAQLLQCQYFTQQKTYSYIKYFVYFLCWIRFDILARWCHYIVQFMRC